jgi:dTDP-4-dehydrorhamnose 3,5-epimerase
MRFQETALHGAFLIELTPYRDDRGLFARTFCAQTFREKGLVDTFVQTNHVKTARRGTIRGLHYQAPPAPEAKIVRCVRGAVQDVMVDLRRGSPTFLHWHSEVLTDRNLLLVYAPAGFAHGYQSLEEGTEVTYQSSALYTPGLEGGVRFNDPLLKISWMVSEAILSAKDANWPLLTTNFKGVEF